MATFALLNKDDIVVTVIAVDNHNCLDENGQEQEAFGLEFLNKTFGNYKWPLPDGLGYYNNADLEWKQTSYNAKSGDGFRKNYAGIGYKFNENLDAFVAPEPSAPAPEKVEEAGEWVLNEEKAIYEFTGKLKLPETPK